MIIHIKKENGHTADGRTLDECLASLPNGEYVATVEPKAAWEKRQPRSLNQNALFHVWCKHIAKVMWEYTGEESWTPDEVKRHFAWVFGTTRQSPDGTMRRDPVETHRLNKKQMHEYMERIQAYVFSWCGATVPLPDDDKFAQMSYE